MKHMNHRGITLIELLIAVALVSTILLSTFTALNFGERSFSDLNQQGDLQSQASSLLLRISSQIRQCRRIQPSSGSTRLSLEDSSGQTAIFQWDGVTTLTYSVEGAASKTLSSQVWELQFTVSENSVDILLTLQSGGKTHTARDLVYKR